MAEKPENKAPSKMEVFANFCRKAAYEIKDVFTSKGIDDMANPNVAFYSNEIPFYPSGEKIEYILKYWYGDYDKLEKNHSYIQWLFPNRMPGQNGYASVLTDEEAKIIRNSPKLKERVKRSFEMMLEFYGMKLTENNEFDLAENFVERLDKLNKENNHNYRRITRILLAIKELGHSQLMLPWIKFLIDLIYQYKLLGCATLNFERFWLNSLDAEDDIQAKKYLMHLKVTIPTHKKMDTIPFTTNRTVKQLSITHL